MILFDTCHIRILYSWLVKYLPVLKITAAFTPHLHVSFQAGDQTKGKKEKRSKNITTLARFERTLPKEQDFKSCAITTPP
jgi:hypothetical protein